MSTSLRSLLLWSLCPLLSGSELPQSLSYKDTCDHIRPTGKTQLIPRTPRSSAKSHRQILCPKASLRDTRMSARNLSGPRVHRKRTPPRSFPICPTVFAKSGHFCTPLCNLCESRMDATKLLYTAVTGGYTSATPPVPTVEGFTLPRSHVPTALPASPRDLTHVRILRR